MGGASRSQESSHFSSSSSGWSYHVFLSFRGGDTRKNFTDHLYTALIQAGIHTFRDDDEIKRGENIESEIKNAIRESKISVLVLSKDYASSRWCLDELAMIMERRRTDGHIVVPVFYDADPTEVGKQIGSYGEAFERHEKVFKEEMEMVEGWRAALREVADMGGMVLENRHQSQFIQNIVKEVGNKLNRVVLNVASYLVGIDSRIADINSWLQDDSKDVGIATIYGVGGIGKTTLAKIIFNQNFDKFDGASFLANVRETSEQSNGLVRLQRKVLSDLLKGKTSKIYNVDEGIIKIKDAICRRRVLLILDDLDQLDQFNSIIGMQEWFFPGSKIIATTRHERLLRAHEVSKLFRVNELDSNESLQLFSWHSFGQDHPVEVFEQQSKRAVDLCSGLPLALQVLGSSLSGKSIEVWESALQKLEAVPDSKIQKILRVSYDSLEDDHDKNLFLDIACFFTGMEKNYVISILQGCKFYAVVGINNLIGRCLLTINEGNKLIIHQLLRDMGREIVRQESPEDPGKRSRVWRDKDAFNLLRENTGTETVKGLTLDLQMLKEANTGETYAKEPHSANSTDEAILPNRGNNLKRCGLGFFSRKLVSNGLANSIYEVDLKTKAFGEMNKLKLLRLNCVKLSGDCEDFPKGLVWLFWRGFPLRCIPNNFHLDKLAVLDMRKSSLINVWKGTRLLVALKILNLSHSHCLVKTPNFMGLPSLERLKLKDCVNLIDLDESIGYLRRLIVLDLRGCRNVKRLPVEIGMLESLEKLNLCGCSKLDQLPEEMRKMQSLKVLYADGTALTQIRAMTGQWYSTFWPWLLPRKNPQSISFSLAILPSHLVTLSLADCNLSDVAIPNDLRCLRSLESLDLKGNPIYSIPESINSLTTLQYLCLDKCTRLQSLPQLPTSLEELKAEGCTSLERITNLPNLLSTLQVELFGCGQLVEVQGLFKLEPTINMDIEMMNGLGLHNFSTLGSSEMKMFSAIANREMRSPPQVLQECGIVSFFLAGNEVPHWFDHKSTGSSLSFTINPLSDYKIRGLNLCTVYARDHEVYWLHAAGHYARMNNETKGTNWSYSPTFYALPEDDDEDMLWLSYWKFGGEFEVGDKVNVSVRMPFGYYVKECGIRIVYEENEKDNQSNTADIIPSNSFWHQNITDRDLSPYQVGKSVYFLHHHPFTTPDEILKLAPVHHSEDIAENQMEWSRHLVVTDPNLKFTFT
ncbi:disease resistance protein RPV1-like isoform X2 [Ricinus communis]|uniref:disease resistance protein RPV1-like isoform X2 n=1 Tax=Ricinus communis TaxID=3988 RepID=UPI00201B3470|nr:disease resistance protein RPV1-like isoform X2 [Ricinus communis]